MGLIRDLAGGREGRWLLGLGGVVGLLLGLIVWGMLQEERTWRAFRETRHCTEIGRMNGSTVIGVGPTFGGNGGVAVTVGSIPDKVGWRCDDGREYWR